MEAWGLFIYGAHGVHGEGPASLLLLLGSVEFLMSKEYRSKGVLNGGDFPSSLTPWLLRVFISTEYMEYMEKAPLPSFHSLAP